MAKLKIGFDGWPFEKGERAKLIKISKPYSDMGLWYVKAVYLSAETNKAKFLNHFFGDLHLLVVGVDYINGIRQDMKKWETVDIQLSAQMVSNKEFVARLIADKKYNEFDYYTFGIGVRQEYYIVPLFEIVRAILAPDVFWLNQVTLLESIDTRIFCESVGNILNMYFTTEVPVRYARLDAKIKHAAWIFSNHPIYIMISQVYHNIRSGNGILFDFLFEELSFAGRIEKWNGKNYVREIIACKRKKINCSDIVVNHPGLIEYKDNDDNSSDNLKQTTRRKVDDFDGDKILVSDLAATTNTLDLEEEDFVLSEYSTFAKIKRIKISRNRGKTKTEIQSDDVAGTNKRTTSDYGGLETVPQMEFEHIVSEKLEGDFADIYAVLSLMEERKEVSTVRYYIGKLDEHLRFRTICTLENGVTPRQYFVGIIKMNDGREAMLIEIEREKLSLTTRMFVSLIPQKWRFICHNILKRLIINSGSWPNTHEFEFNDLEVHKFKHTNAEINIKEKRMFESLNIRSI